MKKEKGFTLIELIMVIVILGILAAVAIVAVNYANILPVENALNGKDFRSSVQHHQEEIKILDE